MLETIVVVRIPCMLRHNHVIHLPPPLRIHFGKCISPMLEWSESSGWQEVSRWSVKTHTTITYVTNQDPYQAPHVSQDLSESHGWQECPRWSVMNYIRTPWSVQIHVRIH